jgi:hypothetical protein
MDYYVAIVNKDTREKIICHDQRIVSADSKNDAIEKYSIFMKNNGVGVERDETVICNECINGKVNLQFSTEKFMIIHDGDCKLVKVSDKRTGKTFVGYEIAIIPARTMPTEEEILKYCYRDNLERYTKEAELAKNDKDLRAELRRVRLAYPYDRAVLDMGFSNVIIPITDDITIEEN